LYFESDNSSTSGPGGIRTRDLFSAIEARSQLRYRPITSSVIILNEGCKPVKKQQQASFAAITGEDVNCELN
jgi:hypothetical protein